MAGSFIQRNWFLMGILAAIALGMLFAEIGARLNPGSITSTAIVVALFVITGLTLPAETIWRGMRNLRLHLYLQVFIFCIVPLYFLATVTLAGNLIPDSLRVGVFALACLPTTVSSCVIFTQVAGGNAVGALFNSTLANIAGIFLSPLLLSIVLQNGLGALPKGETIRILRDLALTILLPFIAGQGARFLFAKAFVSRRRSLFATLSNALILLVIFFAFCKSARNEFLHDKAAQLLVPFLYLAVSHLILTAAAYGGARVLRLDGADTIASVFVAPQKTIAMGIPLLTTYFAREPQTLALAIVPLLFYHPWQLLVAGLLRSAPFVRKGAVVSVDAGETQTSHPRTR
jgi:sodium/bile acid cotransporter 7